MGAAMRSYDLEVGYMAKGYYDRTEDPVELRSAWNEKLTRQSVTTTNLTKVLKLHENLWMVSSEWARGDATPPRTAYGDITPACAHPLLMSSWCTHC